jgi:hypothetical protein
MRPLSVKTMIPCRTDRSILKVIVMLFGPVSHDVAALLPSRLSKVQHGGHMQSTETKGLEEKLDDETSVSAGFSGIKKRDLLLLRDKPVFLDLQLLDFRVQRRAGNSEFRCRTFWACNFPFTLRKSRFNKFSLLILESVWQRTC